MPSRFLLERSRARRKQAYSKVFHIAYTPVRDAVDPLCSPRERRRKSRYGRTPLADAASHGL